MLDQEMEHFQQGIHTYSVYEVYAGLKLTLCNFCSVDFGSYRPEYLGFSSGRRIQYSDLVFIKTLEHPVVEKDKVCPSCGDRLAFLKFVYDLREILRREEARGE
jgi:hypothetical protein